MACDYARDSSERLSPLPEPPGGVLQRLWKPIQRRHKRPRATKTAAKITPKNREYDTQSVPGVGVVRRGAEDVGVTQVVWFEYPVVPLVVSVKELVGLVWEGAEAVWGDVTVVWKAVRAGWNVDGGDREIVTELELFVTSLVE